MFGDFNSNFSLNFPIDSNGGLFGATAPVPGVTPPSPAAGGLTGAPLDPKPQAPSSGVGGSGPASPNPLASPMAPGQATPAAAAAQPSPAPAAGLGSPFAGKGGL